MYYNYIEQILDEIYEVAVICGEKSIIGNIIAKHIIESQKNNYIAIEAERYLDKCEQ